MKINLLFAEIDIRIKNSMFFIEIKVHKQSALVTIGFIVFALIYFNTIKIIKF